MGLRVRRSDRRKHGEGVADHASAFYGRPYTFCDLADQIGNPS